MPQSVVSDVVSEVNGTGTGPYTIFNVGGITSGQVNDKITEANAVLRKWVGDGPSDSTDAVTKEAVKRFEVNYAAAKLAQTIMGIVTTDGFNYSLAGLDVQRFGAQFQSYKKFIDDHLEVSKSYIKMLHQWFVIYNQDIPQGVDERGVPLSYWSTSAPRYG